MEELQNTLAPLREILNLKLFTVGDTPVTLSSLLTAMLIVGIGFVVAALADRAIGRALSIKVLANQGGFRASRRLFRYVIILIAFGVAMNVVGIDVSALFTAGAIFAVGIGFAMQTIAQNFVSGVILLVERSIKPGDIVRVEDRMVRIEEMGIRSTIARTRDDEEVIIPNSSLAGSTVINYSLHDRLLRVRCRVGVTYDSNMKLVRQVLEAVGAKVENKALAKPSRVVLVDFADSAVVWELSVWIDRPWDESPLKGEIMEAIWFGLQEADIVIAFPQLDVHFDRDVHQAFASHASPLKVTMDKPAPV